MIRRNLPLALLVLAFAVVSVAAAPQSPRKSSPPAKTPSAVVPKPKPAAASRQQLILRINEERTRVGAPPLAPSETLDKVAQAEAKAIASRGKLPSAADFIKLQTQVFKAGYLAQGLTQGTYITVGGAADVIEYFKNDSTYGEAMRHDYQDVGVGISEFAGIPLYTFLFAWPKSEFYARQTAPLKDLQAVRESMLALVNAQRKAMGRPALSLDPRLNEAAQKHAEDMLARTFYSHETPEGGAAWDRVRAAGYPPDLVGENIAASHTQVSEVMDAWMYSPGHRRNLLDVRFRHIGIGVAVGSYEHRYQVLWVQDFASPERASP